MILSIVNQKGGVGKTTTAINLASYYAISGKKTLLVDMDSQAHATKGLGFTELPEDTPTCLDVIARDAKPQPLITDDKLAIWPGAMDMADFEKLMADNLGRYYRLQKALERWATDYELVIIDCPPNLGIQSLNALTASTHVLIPNAPGYFSIDGIAALLNTIEQVREYTNKSLELLGIVLTQADMRTNLTKETIQFLKETFKLQFFETMIPHAVVLGEAPGKGQPIFHYAPDCKASEAYQSLGEEVFKIGKR